MATYKHIGEKNMIKDYDKAIVGTNELKTTCLKILDKLPQHVEVRVLYGELIKEENMERQIQLCLKVITLMKEYLDTGLIKFSD